jgi:malate dehydrogenase (oxaloacetate-decarboxylating)
MDLNEKSLQAHKKHGGKIGICSKMQLLDKESLSIAYTPGVAAVCKAIHEDKKKVWDYTLKKNTVAVVTDGSAVLGLGNIGPEAALPVMEGKAMLFKELAGVDAFPICLDTQEPSEIISIIRKISPVFGGINIEDIKAPQCFEIEASLQDLGIPVMHDDQHATSIVIQAALQNACKVVGKNIEDLFVVISGAGAAGISTAKMLACMNISSDVCTSVKDIVMVDSRGILSKFRDDLNIYKKEIVQIGNKKNKHGSLKDALEGADVFIGLSVANTVTKEMVMSMNDNAIIFAMANPVPEIMPELAVEAGAAIVGTGRSDYPNQINNVLAFPGVFRGALDAKATRISSEMKMAAANALARSVEPKKDKILPNALDQYYVQKVVDAVMQEAIKTGNVRK